MRCLPSTVVTNFKLVLNLNFFAPIKLFFETKKHKKLLPKTQNFILTNLVGYFQKFDYVVGENF